MALALEGLRVVDVSQGVPGSLCAMQLGDLGAEVIKVEPLDGDWIRQIGPFVGGESALYIQLNRNKKSIGLNLKTAAGQEAFRRLAQTADILVEGYRPGTMDRLGLGYEALAGFNPRLIYCTISGYGSNGPMAGLPGTELDVQALTGKNRQLGVAGEPPLRVGYDIVSVNAAWAASQAVMAALFWRERTGEGQRVETSLLDAAVAILQWVTGAESNPDEWRGSPLKGYTEPPDHGFICKDGPILFTLGRGDEEFRQFCEIIGLPEIADDPRFVDFRQRALNDAALKALLNPVLANWSFDDLRSTVQDGFGGTIVRMNNLSQLASDPQVAALEIIQELEHPTAGPYKTLDVPWEYSEPIVQLSTVPAPLLGQHTVDVLQALGYGPSEIEQLRHDNVIRM